MTKILSNDLDPQFAALGARIDAIADLYDGLGDDVLDRLISARDTEAMSGRRCTPPLPVREPQAACSPDGSDRPSASQTAARAHQEIFAYWASLRCGARLPSRRDLHPSALRSLLGNICLIRVEHEPLRFRFRLCGTGLHRIYGREATGLEFGELYPSGAAQYWRTELEKVVRERRPGVGVHHLGWSGQNASSLWVRLPLADNGADVDHILGFEQVVGVAEVVIQRDSVRASVA